MKVKYANAKTEKQCTSLKEAKKLFGGDKRLATSLLSRINAIEQAEVIKDIVVIPPKVLFIISNDTEKTFRFPLYHVKVRK